jgi:hypothetical protein
MQGIQFWGPEVCYPRVVFLIMAGTSWEEQGFEFSEGFEGLKEEFVGY